jgi:hypothetical protein
MAKGYLWKTNLCPECGSENLAYSDIQTRAQTRYQPAEYAHLARCKDCLWEGDYDDLEIKDA